MRAVFFGSPAFAVPSLEALLEAGFEIPLVVSQPPRPVGRRAVMTDPVVAKRAKDAGLRVYQPESLRTPETLETLAAVEAAVFVVAAYGKILPQRLLELPPLGAVNVHGSVLPRWRGASPIQAALLSGEEETGVTIMKMDAGMDTGPILATERTPIFPDEDAGTLSARLARLGAGLLVRTLVELEAGRLEALEQDQGGATLCPRIRREDGRVDWSLPAVVLERRARAYSPWPGLFAFRGPARVKIQRARAAQARGNEKPGTVLEAGERLVVACGTDALSLEMLQAEGRRPLSASMFCRGERVEASERWA